ncbi:MAG: CdaR family transcriptional regulator [Suipraeoptans sp.]
MEISKNLAKQIVMAVAEVINADINLINVDGIIIGSTNKKRIGVFHDAGYNAIKSAKPMTVDSTNISKGIKEGVNYPIFLSDSPIAAIGITGEPEVVSKYGFLVTKITEVFLKDQLLNEEINSRDRIVSNIVSSLIHGDIKNSDKLNKMLNKFHTCLNDTCSVLSINVINNDILPSLKHYFISMNIHFMLYVFPSELVVLISERNMSDFNSTNFIDTYKGQVEAGMGTSVSFSNANISYVQAVHASQYAHNRNETFYDSKDITTPLLLSDISPDLRDTFISNTLSALTSKELDILKSYLNNNLSLKFTSEALFIHKNTLQYQLDKITEKSGFNPRNFNDAFLLNLGLLLSDVTK